ncbi:MAG: hypothetical protein EBU90_07230 [Proteobacteria bacterium]|nr:hypothetical protein [Pseudomonadota bacterium]
MKPIEKNDEDNSILNRNVIEEYISKEDLKVITSQKNVIQTLSLQTQIAKLSLENTTLRIYLKYKLNENDVIEEENGKIVRS